MHLTHAVLSGSDTSHLPPVGNAGNVNCFVLPVETGDFYLNSNSSLLTGLWWCGVVGFNSSPGNE